MKEPLTFTHLNENNLPSMVDVGDKEITHRVAVATSAIDLPHDCLKDLTEKKPHHKGPILETCVLAAITSVKRTSESIPLCHPLSISGVDVKPEIDEASSRLTFRVEVKTDGKTGVEMEAMHGASIAALTFYDMVKSKYKALSIGPIRLEEKSGGKSGLFKRASH